MAKVPQIPLPPRNSKRLDTATSLPFEILWAMFLPRYDGVNDRVTVQIRRHLPMAVEIDELYLNFILRGSDDLAVPEKKIPAYYGDGYHRRTQTPVPSQLDDQVFFMHARVVPMSGVELPNGPVTPTYDGILHPFEISYHIKAPKPGHNQRDYMMVELQPEGSAAPGAGAERVPDPA